MPGTAEYDALVAKLDAFSQRVEHAQREWLTCRRGCDQCCRQSRSAFAVELEQIRKYVAEQSTEFRTDLKRRLNSQDVQAGERCIFLNEEGSCDVYPVRPIICRTHGPAVQMAEQGLVWCELNFAELNPQDVADLVPDGSVLDVNLVNQMLALINQQYVHEHGGQPYAPLTTLVSESD